MLQSGFAAASVGYPLHSQHVSRPNVLQCMHVKECKEAVSFYSADQSDANARSGNFYSHGCRLGAPPDCFIVLSGSLWTDAYECRSNCPQAEG